jgi:hypothetical protein
MSHNPIAGTGTHFTSANGTAASAAFSVKSDTLRVTSKGSVDVNIVLGTAPTADSTDYVLLADTSTTLGLTPKSIPVIGITTGSTTTYHFPEGTGCPFNAGDTVTITGLTPTTLNGTHVSVASVETSADVSGYYSTRAVITKDSRTSTIATASTATFNGAEMRNSLKLSAKGSGTGSEIHLVQVQVSGDA